MSEFEKPRILTLVGISGTGKTTLMRNLMESDDFRVVRGVFNRPPRINELNEENLRITDDEFDQLARDERLLWDIKAGYGVRYGIDTDDIERALRDTDHQYVNALIPEAAITFIRHCGPRAVRTMFVPAPPPEVLRQRMLDRGDDPEKVEARLQHEDSAEWLGRLSVIENLHVTQATTIEGLHAEALQLMSS